MQVFKQVFGQVLFQHQPEQYNRVDSSFPDRIMKMAENHNINNTKSRYNLLICGLAICAIAIFSLIGASVYFGIQEEYKLTFFFAIVPTLTLLKVLFSKI